MDALAEKGVRGIAEVVTNKNVYNDKVRIVSPDNQLLYEVENIRKLPKKRGRVTSQKEAAMDAVFSYCQQWLGATFEMPKGIENEFAQGNVPDSVLLSPSVATFAKADAATPSTSMEEQAAAFDFSSLDNEEMAFEEKPSAFASGGFDFSLDEDF